MERGTSTRRENWDDFWKGKAPAAGRPSWSKRRMTALLDNYVRGGMAVLDAGCGSGFFTSYFIGRGCEAYALDYSDEALEAARRLTGGMAAGYIQADLLDAALGEGRSESFDLVFSDGLFEHFSGPDQKKIMDNFVSMLRPGGLVVTFCPNRYSPWQIIRPLWMPGIKETPLTKEGMARLHGRLELLESGGLNVLPVRWSPEFLGGRFGMLLYCIARKGD